MPAQVITAQFLRTQVFKFLARGCQLFETEKFSCSTSPRSNDSLTWLQLWWARLYNVTQLVIFFTPYYTFAFWRVCLDPSHNFEDFLWGLIFLLLTGYILSYNCMQHSALRCKRGNSFYKLLWWAYTKIKTMCKLLQNKVRPKLRQLCYSPSGLCTSVASQNVHLTELTMSTMTNSGEWSWSDSGTHLCRKQV